MLYKFTYIFVDKYISNYILIRMYKAFEDIIDATMRIFVKLGIVRASHKYGSLFPYFEAYVCT